MGRRRRPCPDLDAPQPAHRLIRDAVEAEVLAVEWLRWRGFDDARRIAEDQAHGIRATDLVADVSFDPLPMEVEVLDRLRQRADRYGFGQLVSFTFAGWSVAAFELAEAQGIPLVRFTFAGRLDPNSSAALALAAPDHT